MTCSIKDCSDEFTTSVRMEIEFIDGLQIDRVFYVEMCKEHKGLIPDPPSEKRIPIITKWWKKW